MAKWRYEELPTPADLSVGSLQEAIERYLDTYGGESPSLVLYGYEDHRLVQDVLGCEFTLTFYPVAGFLDRWMVVGADGAVGSGGV
jgi:hypothetical protein